MLHSVQSIRESGPWLSDSRRADWHALRIRGADIGVTTADQFEEMVARRPNTRLRTLAGEHVVHLHNPEAFTDAARSFLREQF